MIDFANGLEEPICVVAPRGTTILAAGIAAALRSVSSVKVVGPAQLHEDDPGGAGMRGRVLLVADDPASSPSEVIAGSLAAAGESSRRWLSGVAMVMQGACPQRIVEYLQLGARVFVCHDAPLDDLLGAVHAADRGEVFLPHGIAVQIIDSVLPHLPFFSPGTPAPVDKLTGREREIYSHMVAGQSNAEIALACYLSQKTVKFHVSNILRKLGVRTRLQAVAQVRQPGRAEVPVRRLLDLA
ncbi:helix-turn-helix transcriptional regulator [Streptomyces sp. NRRL F-5123]|uniref:helix-turn-helix transcriptional regulator n=1 Tax=Streptomyces sp. NRRL F-5123 TaxID=1463856 RepID=UPI000693ADA2|nr:response regulator transcription factor [Streptomyces sp. NRRL F-5123]